MERHRQHDDVGILDSIRCPSWLGSAITGPTCRAPSTAIRSSRCGDIALTDAGEALLPVLEQIGRWAGKHLPVAAPPN